MLLFSVANIAFAAFCILRATLPDWVYDTAEMYTMFARFYAEDAYETAAGWLADTRLARFLPAPGSHVTKMFALWSDGGGPPQSTPVALHDLPRLLARAHQRSTGCATHLAVFYTSESDKRAYAALINLQRFKATDTLVPHAKESDPARGLTLPTFLYVGIEAEPDAAADNGAEAPADLTQLIAMYAGPNRDFHADTAYVSRDLWFYVDEAGLPLVGEETRLTVIDGAMDTHVVSMRTFGLLYAYPSPTGTEMLSDCEFDASESDSDSDSDSDTAQSEITPKQRKLR